MLKLRNPWEIEAWSGDWSNISDRWTEELRGQLGYIKGSAEQKAVFFIRFEDYVEQFKRTCIAAHFVREPQAHSRVKHSFKYDKSLGTTKPAFFRLFLDRELDLAQETFSISVHQQGARLATYKQQGNPNRYQPASFSIMLFTADGKLIDSCRGVDTFTPTLQPKRGVLEASGDGYVLMIDSPWEHIQLKKISNEQ